MTNCSKSSTKVRGEELLSLGQSFSTITSRISFTVFNEVKKLFVILSLFVSLLLNFIPVLSILSILVQSILLSVNYLDYVWSLNDLSLKGVSLLIRRTSLLIR